METDTLIKIIEFIEKVDGVKMSFKQKIKNGIPLTEDELNIDDDVNLSGTNIESLPEGLYVGGDLWLSGSEIETLPEGLYVGGALFLDYCNKLKSLPKGLEVDGGVNITYTQLTKYTKEELRKMIEPGYIKGDILNEDPEWVEFF
jgi:hypothetical protein